MPRRKKENNDVIYIKTDTKMTEENLQHQLLSDTDYK